MARTVAFTIAVAITGITGIAGCNQAAGNQATIAQTPDSAKRERARTEIAAMMQESAHNWTGGNLDAFMDSYEIGDVPTFVTPRGVIHGRDSIRAVYAPRFVVGALHDSLSFEKMEVDLLAPGLANVIAYYRLTRGDSTTGYGPTSLVMRKRDGTWRIIHDHSS